MKKIYPELEQGMDPKSKVAKAGLNKPQWLVIHHTGGTDKNPLADSSNFTFKQCDDYHKLLWNYKSSLGFYCGYHYYIEKNGKVYQARADSDLGAHTVGYNDKSIGICLAGNFDSTMPTAAQTKALGTLLMQKLKEHNLRATAIVPHRKFAVKTCYGNKLPDTWAQLQVSTSIVEEVDKLHAQVHDLLVKAFQ
jgi:N-acetyl-anhydromuramyl-L-alanine amidase AmpD